MILLYELLFLKAPGGPEIISLVVIIILLLCSALVSGSEVAYFSLSPSQLNDLSNSTAEADIRIETLLRKPEQLLATILILNNLVNIAIVVLSSVVVSGIFDFDVISTFWALFIQIGIVTFIILMAGEVLPKVYASTHNLSLARFMSSPLLGLGIFLKPLSLSLMAMGSFIKNRVKQDSELTVGHLEHAMEITKDENARSEETKILEGIVKFGNIDVKQVMTPRVDTFAVDITTDFEELLNSIVDKGYSRIPVYKDSLDEVRGILYLKDLIPFVKMKKLNWQKLIRAAFFVPESKKIDDLLTEFQGTKRHLAVVVDEYGGTSGIITLEDVIEEIVGEITDEFDDDDLNYTKIDSHNYVVEGKTPLVDMYRILEIEGEDFEAAKGESDTLAGFIIEQAGKIPLKNERIDFKGFTFIIEAADRRKVRQVKITMSEEVDENE
ncbi:MAG: gliding motility-associated protein GldE [Flavobacteriales bacterium]|nr:gliding motility-associated protein GldE [Flavobacteriales bacterium]